uniref:Iron-binding zinc finger CDGSH type domain-containing protein n=1 Tax=Meloidogyne enterolobii TaxID=390850 RepID=A0A6V7X0D6_MELEN|nr:unnamed protein product [Meloidogyne enterolobii]
MSNSTFSTDALGKAQIALAITFLAGGLTIGYLIGRRTGLAFAVRHNKRISLEKDKIADKVDLEDIGDKKVFCRCWQSKKFPFCDGSHMAHNKETGDNLGPLIIQKRAS